MQDNAIISCFSIKPSNIAKKCLRYNKVFRIDIEVYRKIVMETLFSSFKFHGFMWAVHFI